MAIVFRRVRITGMSSNSREAKQSKRQGGLGAVKHLQVIPALRQQRHQVHGASLGYRVRSPLRATHETEGRLEEGKERKSHVKANLVDFSAVIAESWWPASGAGSVQIREQTLGAGFRSVS